MTRRTRYYTKILPPSPDEFRAQARQSFAFLSREFRFREQAIPAGFHNPVAVWFVNASTRVVVEGINHAADARVAIGRAGPPEAFENIDLHDLATVRCPALALTEGQKRAEQEGGQWVQLPRMAEWLRQCAAEVLVGDFSVFPEILQLRERRLQEWRQQSDSEAPEA